MKHESLTGPPPGLELEGLTQAASRQLPRQLSTAEGLSAWWHELSTLLLLTSSKLAHLIMQFSWQHTDKKSAAGAALRVVFSFRECPWSLIYDQDDHFHALCSH